MAIAERQLETWAQQGKTGQFTDTYKSIRGNLLDGSPRIRWPTSRCSCKAPTATTRTSGPTATWTSCSAHRRLYYDLSQLPKDQQDAIRETSTRRKRHTATKQFKARCRRLHQAALQRRAGRQEGSLRARATTAAGTRISSSASSSDATTSYEPGNIRLSRGRGVLLGRQAHRELSEAALREPAPRNTRPRRATSSRWCGSSRTCATR